MEQQRIPCRLIPQYLGPSILSTYTIPLYLTLQHGLPPILETELCGLMKLILQVKQAHWAISSSISFLIKPGVRFNPAYIAPLTLRKLCEILTKVSEHRTNKRKTKQVASLLFIYTETKFEPTITTTPTEPEAELEPGEIPEHTGSLPPRPFRTPRTENAYMLITKDSRVITAKGTLSRETFDTIYGLHWGIEFKKTGISDVVEKFDYAITRAGSDPYYFLFDGDGMTSFWLGNGSKAKDSDW
ncbi:hypothetical protein HK097_011514 [Rhizophlyctis rosea]|uniref:Uncharacterized protein n=1 Tax=Rhizophlyctis rosea TaxID=64517 RepID=A0AAD5S9B2_9FUNG|nr:hypothetical protein HK097_011514 [Rhizophlyctis rosea]